MDITKTGFASGVIGIYLQRVTAAHSVAEYNLDYITNLRVVEGTYEGAIVDTTYGDSAESFYLDGMFESLDEVYGEIFLDDENETYQSSGGVHPEWNSSGLDLETIFESTTGPSGEDISLVNFMGPLVYAAMGEPPSVDEFLANPEGTVTMERAEMWDFAHPTDLNVTLARDWTLYGGMGSLMSDYGALDDDYLTNESEDAVNLSTRMEILMDIEISNEDARKVLTLGDETSEPLGILAVSDSGTSFGLSAFLEMTLEESIETFGISEMQHYKLKEYVSAWADDTNSLPLILLGEEGYITGSEFVNQTFGSVNPIDGEYLEYSLNVGGMWGSGVLGFPSAPAINLTQEESARMLYGEYGLTTEDGASMFLYGELSGKTLPINYSTGEEAPAVEWTDEVVAQIYDIDENAASAARLLMMEVVFKNFVPDFLKDSFGTSLYLTQSVNNWIMGWHDPVNAYLASGDSTNMTVGWTSLEANETFYGSDQYVEGGISTGDPAVITICTGVGQTDICDKGETVRVGDSDYISWRTPEKEDATYGLIKAELRGETTGGYLTGEGDLVDLSGYGVAEINCASESELKGLPVDVCTATMDPLTRPIQAKLINNGDLLDAIPGALPVYFGSDVELKAEKVSQAIIAGKSESVFYLDTRNTTEQQTPPTMDDLQKVFMIKTSGELDDETADDLVSSIVTNQDPVMYFTNFDHWVDWVTLTFWVLGGILVIFAMIKINRPGSSNSKGEWNTEPKGFEMTSNVEEPIDYPELNTDEILSETEDTTPDIETDSVADTD